MNLHEVDPNFADEEICINLDQIYNEHVRHTHQRALEEVFLAGIQYAIDRQQESPARQELEELRERHDALQIKYDALNARFNINQSADSSPEMQEKLMTQAMDMGNVFRCGTIV